VPVTASGMDIVLGLLAGMVSCLTPEALLLLPLLIAAIGADDRPAIVAIAIGLGLSQVVTGPLTGLLGLDAVLLRRVICAALLLLGVGLMSTSVVDRYSGITGGQGRVFKEAVAPLGSALRLLLLALVVGANWVPQVGPALGKAMLLAADEGNSGNAFGVLFVFGAAAAVPWIVAGRIARLLLLPVASSGLDGMSGKRVLGLTLLAVAVIGISGMDATIAHGLGAMSPAWIRKLAVTF
jgi:cytochrome c-type biogenesis protein